MLKLRRLVKTAWCRALVASGIPALMDSVVSKSNIHSYRILVYHRVTNAGSPNPFAQSMNVSPATFAHQLDFLQARFNVMSLEEITVRFEQQKPLPHNAIALTFDDGYQDTYANAFPRMQERAIPAMLFVATDYVGSDRMFWWDELECRVEAADFSNVRYWMSRYFGRQLPQGKPQFYKVSINRLSAIKQKRFEQFWHEFRMAFPEILSARHSNVDWDQLREMDQRGFRAGSHTVSHAILSRLSKDEWERELTESKTKLEAELGHEINWLAYPRGDHGDINAEIVTGVKHAGYRGALLNVRGGNRRTSDPYQLRRIPVYGDEPFEVFVCRVYGLI